MKHWLKKTGALGFSIMIALLWLEAFSYIGYYVYAGQLFSYSHSQRALQEQTESDQDILDETQDIRQRRTRFLRNTNASLHPYLGYGPVPGIKGIGDDFLVKKRDSNLVRVILSA